MRYVKGNRKKETRLPSHHNRSLRRREAASAGAWKRANPLKTNMVCHRKPHHFQTFVKPTLKQMWSTQNIKRAYLVAKLALTVFQAITHFKGCEARTCVVDSVHSHSSGDASGGGDTSHVPANTDGAETSRWQRATTSPYRRG